MRVHRQMDNLALAKLLKAVAAAYKLKSEAKNKFKVAAYERAAAAVEHLSSEAKDLWDEGKLDEVAGIGKSIAEHLSEIFKKGKSTHFAKVLKGLPPAVFTLMEVPGIGAKTAFKLAGKLGIKESEGAIEKLEKAVKEGKVAGIEGFGQESQESMEKAIKEAKGRGRRILLPYASQLAEEILEWLRKSRSVKKAEALGSVRRKDSTVGDIDIAVASEDPQAVIKHFTNYPKKVRTLEKGEKTASIITPGKRQVDLMVADPSSFGALLQHFTGSKHHNIELREYALKRNLSLSEYGIKNKTTTKMTKFPDEESFYNALGMDYIPPELREGTGEIEAALRPVRQAQGKQAQGKQGGLPRLVEFKDIKADLQIHSNFDIETSHDLGESSMAEIVDKANSLGYEYLAFTEHNPSKGKHSEKETIELLKRKKEAIEKINYSLVKGVNIEQRKSTTQLRQGYAGLRKVFNSLEIDIMPDGTLPVSEKGLDLLDFALVSIHSSFRLERKAMTKRVLLALAHPKVKVLAHPTARKLNQREGVELNWPEILEFCRANSKFLEINAEPMRLDLPDFLVKEAVKTGVKLTIGTDAHHESSLDNMEYGVYVARRGWATKADILNTLPLSEFEKMVR